MLRSGVVAVAGASAVITFPEIVKVRAVARIE